MADAKIVLSDDTVTASLRRGKHAEREAQERDANQRQRKGPGKYRRSKDFQSQPAPGRGAAHQKGE